MWPRRDSLRPPASASSGNGRFTFRGTTEALFECAEALDEVVDRNERRPSREADEEHLQGGTRLTAPDDAVEPVRKALVHANEVVRVASGREIEHVLALLVREVE